jgi:hypothetical protein
MKQIVKHVAVAALAVTTMGAATTQAQAGSDLRRAFVGAVAVGIIVDKLDKKRSSRHVATPQYSSRSVERSRLRSGHRSRHRVIRQNSHRAFERTRRSRHLSRHSHGH